MTRFHMCGINWLYVLWFTRYSTFKFWSRDYHVIMTSHNFSIQPNKCRIYHGFICVVAIGSICHGSLAITLLSFGHVTMTRDNDVTKIFHIAQATIQTIIFKTCGRNRPYLLYFSQYKRCKIGRFAISIYIFNIEISLLGAARCQSNIRKSLYTHNF